MPGERMPVLPDCSPRIGGHALATDHWQRFPSPALRSGIAKSGGYSVMGSAGVLYWFG